MNTIAILHEMRNTTCFKGVFPLDKIDNLKFEEKPFGIIINLDYANEPGSHWVALFIDEKNDATYFDSFGFPNFNEHIIKFLMTNKVNQVVFNKYQLQSLNSSTCGAYCVLFIKMKCNNFSLNDFIKLFSNNKERNDLLSVKYLTD